MLDELGLREDIVYHDSDLLEDTAVLMLPDTKMMSILKDLDIVDRIDPDYVVTTNLKQIRSKCGRRKR